MESITAVSDRHKTKTLESHFNKPIDTIRLGKEEDKREVLEKHFNKPYNKIDQEMFEDLTLIESKKIEKAIFTTEHYFYNGNYGTRYLGMEKIQEE